MVFENIMIVFWLVLKWLEDENKKLVMDLLDSVGLVDKVNSLLS